MTKAADAVRIEIRMSMAISIPSAKRAVLLPVRLCFDVLSAFKSVPRLLMTHRFSFADPSEEMAFRHDLEQQRLVARTASGFHWRV